MKVKEVIGAHLKLCEDAYALISEENKTLKCPGASADAELLARKKELLGRLSLSSDSLRYMNEQSSVLDAEAKDLAKRAQNMLMKIFMLDRENEQLLLKVSSGPSAPSQPQNVSAQKLANLYKSENGVLKPKF